LASLLGAPNLRSDPSKRLAPSFGTSPRFRAALPRIQSAGCAIGGGDRNRRFRSLLSSFHHRASTTVASGARGAFGRRSLVDCDPLDESLFTGSAAAIGQWGRPPHVFIDVRKLRLDPAGAPLSRALWGRMRFYDFCKRDLLRARPRTTRTSRPLSYGRDCCRRLKVAFQSRRPPELREVRG
jgi:hypothetical protein